VNVRRLPIALALGVPASLIGHSLLFGAEHEIGGPLHGAVVSLTFAALLLASWLLSKLARVLVRAIASVALAIAQANNAPRESQWRICAAERPRAIRALTPRRHFVRPPPATAAALRA
jgi:hypothetical protein